MSLPAKTSADRPGARLKQPTGWFAAGREVSRALPLLSDGAFKLYIHLCLTADRSTGQYKGDHADLAKALDKSRRSVVIYVRNCGAREFAKHSRPGISTVRVRSRSATPFGLTKDDYRSRSRKAWQTTPDTSAVCWRAGPV